LSATPWRRANIRSSTQTRVALRQRVSGHHSIRASNKLFAAIAVDRQIRRLRQLKTRRR